MLRLDVHLSNKIQQQHVLRDLVILQKKQTMTSIKKSMIAATAEKLVSSSYLYLGPTYGQIVSDIAIFVLKRDVKLQLTN